jgi:hypothetical protein
MGVFSTAVVGSFLVLLVSVPFFSRPWEQPGAVRRDCEPHRGSFLATLAFCSILCGFLGFLLIPAVAGVILAGLGSRMAAVDLGKIENGLLDPDGKEETEIARHQFRVGLILNLVFLFLYAGLGFLLLYVGP